MASGRMHLPGTVHLVTNRCFQQRLLLLPSDKVNFIIGYWLARALARFGKGIRIYAFIFLSNHFHLLLLDTDGSLARFMGYFLSNVAKAVNRELGRSGAFWQGHYDDQIVTSDELFMSKYTYVTCNAVKAGLVDTAEEWIGFGSLRNALSGAAFRFTALNQDRFHKACRNRKKKPDPKEFEETYEFSLTPPPGLESKPIAEQAAHLLPLIREQEAFCRQMRENKPPLGVEAVRRQSPTDRPVSPASSPRKRFACKDRGELVLWQERYRYFIAEYREVYHQFRQSSAKRQRFHGEWPTGSYPPSTCLPMGYESRA